MQSIHIRGRGRPAGLFLVLMLVVPLLNGCSQLGIATTDELEASENRLASSNQSTQSRIADLEKSTGDMQQTLDTIAASVDSLNASFQRASVWLREMNLDTITSRAAEATEAAEEAEARTMLFLQHYLDWVKGQNAILDEQIKTLETAISKSQAGSADDAGGATPADDSSGDGGN
jgi:hypothetical protein